MTFIPFQNRPIDGIVPSSSSNAQRSSRPASVVSTVSPRVDWHLDEKTGKGTALPSLTQKYKVSRDLPKISAIKRCLEELAGGGTDVEEDRTILDSFKFDKHNTLGEAGTAADSATSTSNLYRGPVINFRGPTPESSSSEESVTMKTSDKDSHGTGSEAKDGAKGGEMPNLASLFFGTSDGGAVP